MRLSNTFAWAARAVAVFIIALMAVENSGEAAIVGGTLTSNTTWAGSIFVFSNVVVPSGLTLTVQAGTTVLLTNGVSISAQSGGAIDVQGAATNPVSFLPMNGNNAWGNIAASGNNSFITIRFAEISRGGVNLGSQATALIEDSYVHDVTSAIVGNAARMVTMRRIHVKNYGETIFNSGTIILAEDSLFENLTSANNDALEIQGGPPGSIIRRCTFRHATGSNTDAIDFNGTSGVLVQDCLVYDVSDKGASLGAAGAGGTADFNITISNCLIYSVNTGIVIKDGSTCGLFNNTIADSPFGLRLYQKFTTPSDGGHVTNSFNNLLWNVGTALSLSNNSSVVATYSDFQGTNWTGTGNISSDPLFINAAQRDYRLATNSPARDTGKNGADMGAHFPVGAPMAPSHPRFESVAVASGVATLRFYCDSEKSYTVQSSDTALAGSWVNVANVFPTALPRLVEITNSIGASTKRFYRLVTPALP